MKLETEYIPIEQLNPWNKNPRLHNLNSLVESIKEFGFRDPISINENNNEIEEGHGRLKALKQLKEAGSEPPAFIIQENETWLVPVQRFNDTELNQKRYSLAHNRVQELGGYDEPLLLETLVDLKEDLFATGFSQDDIEQSSCSNDNSIEQHWQRMPEFENNDNTAFKKLYIHFETEEDLIKFMNLIGQNINEKTKSIWFPKKERKDLKKCLVDES